MHIKKFSPLQPASAAAILGCVYASAFAPAPKDIRTLTPAHDTVAP